MINANELVGESHIVFITLDTLRYDVAQELFHQGALPNLQHYLPASGWELRHTPGSFTYAAHQAFFAGFFPTPAKAGKHPRLFAARFEGSETTQQTTYTFDTPDIVSGLRQKGYHTICIGGVGFFNKRTPLSRVFPDMFHESHWEETFGVTDPESTKHQFQRAVHCLEALPDQQRFFLFINVSAIHQPNYFYLDPEKKEDNLASHAAALKYVDSQLPILTDYLKTKGKTLCILCADHGTTYGENGYQGHRLAHPKVWEVPYLETVINQ
ncbi:STM4013/SEN3800 family hydrolase [Rapidithrix thailandica]|uniref:STM4013/SEN3800 family hydrolase n=1 Tax=Rapidithrix thailandica TaxID=413964 RepID=A0AAW9SAS6_9BACT